MSKKLVGILAGACVAAFGLLLLLTSILENLEVINIIFGVLLMVGGAACLALAIVGLVKTKKLPFILCLGAMGGLFLGIMLVVPEQLNVFVVFGILVYAVPAVGLALVFHGIYLICKKETIAGLIETLIGVGAAVIGMLYLFVPEFQQVFWIIAGILLMLYGIYMIVLACLKKEAK